MIALNRKLVLRFGHYANLFDNFQRLKKLVKKLKSKNISQKSKLTRSISSKIFIKLREKDFEKNLSHMCSRDCRDPHRKWNIFRVLLGVKTFFISVDR